MWFKLASATFSTHLGSMSSLSNSISIKYTANGFSYTTTSVNKTASSASLVLNLMNGWTCASTPTVSVTGAAKVSGTPTWASNKLTISLISSAGSGKTFEAGGSQINVTVTGAVSNTPINPTPGTIAFPLVPYGLGVTSNGTGRLSDSTTRLCNGSTTEKVGILVPANHTITLYGLASGTYPLRFDYVYGTVNAVNPPDGSSTPIEGLLGTASNYNSSNYFPLNTAGADSYSVINSYGQDCYFWFGFAGLNKSESITAAIDTYNITYKISATTSSGGELPSGYSALPTTKNALGVTSTGTGRAQGGNAKRFSTADTTKANGILIPAGKTIHLVGLASGTYPLRVDYLYGTQNVKNPATGSTEAIAGLAGTASNYESSNYFPLNTSGANTLDITNNYGQDYYFWFGFAGQTLNEGILAAYDTYTLGYKID